MAVTAKKHPKRTVSRVRILDAAATLFREQGYAAVSLRAMAMTKNGKKWKKPARDLFS